MNKLRYPDEDILRKWVSLLTADIHFGKYVPNVGDDWYGIILRGFGIVQMNPANKKDVFRAGASLFYRIIKNHDFVDGNKRSAVITTYVFFLTNGWHIACTPDHLSEIAKRTAKSKGFSILRVSKLRLLFQKYCRPSDFGE